MRKLIAILGAVALCASLAPAEQKTQAQLSDAVYDVQKGKDSVNQIEVLRVKGAGTIGGALTVTGALTASGGLGTTALDASKLTAGTVASAIAGQSITNLSAANLKGNVPLASLTNQIGKGSSNLDIRTGVCTNGQTISFTAPLPTSTPIITATWEGPADTATGSLFVSSASVNSFVINSTIASTNRIFYHAIVSVN